MLDLFSPIASAARISIGADERLPIAVIGAGAIVDYAHLPAYRGQGLEIAGVYDIDHARAADVASRHGVPRVYTSLEEALGDAAAPVIDIAVVPWAQPDIVRAGLDAGKHILCQKPLALELDAAIGLAEAGERAGRKLAVNQQLRFDEGIAAAREMVRAGWIGSPTTMSFTVNIATDWSAWPWLVSSERLELMYHSIHYLDAVRSILGDPMRVFCAASRTPGQTPVAETRTISTLLFKGDVRAILHVTHENRTRDPEATFRIDGTAGAIRGTLGLLYDYPHGRPDTLDVFSLQVPTDGWLPYPVTTRWLPDAFAGPMAGLLQAVADDGEPPTSARNNIGTVSLVHALYRSVDTGEAQAVGL